MRRENKIQVGRMASLSPLLSHGSGNDFSCLDLPNVGKQLIFYPQVSFLMNQTKPKITLQVSPKSGDIDNIADEGSVVHLVLQYEKLNDSVPDPHLQLQLAVILVEETDNFLNQA
ncbi:hypothetical protein L3X38_006180 [Prunus dulcis]|uniref:Bet v I/Major latex protein domain-containing protein n=1 Tax=Prunus dulcis TaxID=3755 RepID=A0AAD4ZS22_PRUDU|nr:hypothetical protein L3X38_006180 [Prunus dulcis]